MFTGWKAPHKNHQFLTVNLLLQLCSSSICDSDVLDVIWCFFKVFYCRLMNSDILQHLKFLRKFKYGHYYEYFKHFLLH